MIINNIVPVQVPRLRGEMVITNFCIDDCIATYAHYVNTTYEFMYIDTWDFQYRMKNIGTASISSRVSIETNNYENLLNYCGIEVQYYEDDLESSKKLMINELEQGNPIIFVMDAFFCPWDRAYQIYHTEGHAFLLVGWDEETDQFTCVDAYFMRENVVISFNLMKKGYVSFLKLKYIPNNNYLDENNVFIQKLKTKIGKEYFYNIENFVKDIADPTKLQAEFNDYDNNILNFRLREVFDDVITNRICFSILLQYIANKNNVLHEELFTCVNRLIHVSEQWNAGISIVTKGAIKKDYSFISERLTKRLGGIIANEKDLIDDILNIFDHNFIKVNFNEKSIRENPIDSKVCRKDDFYSYLELEQYFNNEGVGSIDSKTADFTNMGQYFLKDLFPGNGILEYQDMKFQLSKVDGKKDNISCTLQSIEVPKNCYNQLMVLGCSEWGSFKDDIKICYSDDSFDIYSLTFMDFLIKTSIDDPVQTVCDCKTIDRINGKNIRKETIYHLYGQIFDINSNKKINRIVLPDCPNMHIFAISLRKRYDG